MNDAFAIYFADVTLARAFVTRWCSAQKVEIVDGMYRVGNNDLMQAWVCKRQEETDPDTRSGRRPSTLLFRPITWGNVDLVHSMAISVSFAEDRTVLVLSVDPGDRERKFFGVTAERDGDRITNRNPGRQGDVVIGPAGGGHHPTATLGQHTRAARYYRFGVIGPISSNRPETAYSNQEAHYPNMKPRHQLADRLRHIASAAFTAAV